MPLSIGTIRTIAVPFVDRSGNTGATAGSFTQIAPANGARQYFRVTNTGSATIYVWDKNGSPVQAGCIPIAAGQQEVWDAKISTAAILVMSQAASVNFEGAEG